MSKEHSQQVLRAISAVATYLALVVEVATVFCLREHQVITLEPMEKQYPMIDLRVFLQLPKLALLKPKGGTEDLPKERV